MARRGQVTAGLVPSLVLLAMLTVFLVSCGTQDTATEEANVEAGSFEETTEVGAEEETDEAPVVRVTGPVEGIGLRVNESESGFVTNLVVRVGEETTVSADVPSDLEAEAARLWNSGQRFTAEVEEIAPHEWMVVRLQN